MRADEIASGHHLDDGRCADLVLGLLPDEERRAGLDHATGCPACAARLCAHVGAAERARAEWRERRRAEPGVSRPSATWLRPHRLALVAAAAVVMAIPLLKPRPAIEPAPHWLPAPGEAVRTRGGTVGDPHLEAGLAAYIAHDLETAERELSIARVDGPDEQLRRLYLGHVRLALGDAGRAVALLLSLDWSLIPEPWRREGAVALARALRQTGRTAPADSIENALRELPPESPFVP